MQFTRHQAETYLESITEHRTKEQSRFQPFAENRIVQQEGLEEVEAVLTRVEQRYKNAKTTTNLESATYAGLLAAIESSEKEAGEYVEKTAVAREQCAETDAEVIAQQEMMQEQHEQQKMAWHQEEQDRMKEEIPPQLIVLHLPPGTQFTIDGRTWQISGRGHWWPRDANRGGKASKKRFQERQQPDMQQMEQQQWGPTPPPQQQWGPTPPPQQQWGLTEAADQEEQQQCGPTEHTKTTKHKEHMKTMQKQQTKQHKKTTQQNKHE